MKITYGIILFCASAIAQPITFSDKAQTAHVVNMGGSHGVAVSDFDNDGWDDIFVALISNPNDPVPAGSLLYHNNHDGSFTNIAHEAGVDVVGNSVCAVWGDVNNDGYGDLFVCARDGYGTNHLFLNKKSGVFADISATAGIDTMRSVGAAAFGDFDGDGKIDLFITARDGPDLLYHNISAGGEVTFEDVSNTAGIGGEPGTIAMQVPFIDYDHDGKSDIFCVHDGFDKSQLFHNNGDGTFTDLASVAKIDYVGAGNSMGVSWADVDNNGWEDVYITRIKRGGFHRNNGDGTFTDIAVSSGAERNGMSWGIVFADFDNDGDEDIFIGNTYGYDGTPSLFYENVNGKFYESSEAFNVAFDCNTYGLATGDFNNDGYQDIFMTSTNGQNKLLINSQTRAGSWLEVRLHGTTVNYSAIGATIRVVAGEKKQRRTVSGGNGYCSQTSSTLHFGLATASVIDTLEVIWKKGDIQRFTNVAVNAIYSLSEGSLLTAVQNSNPSDQRTVPDRYFLAQNFPNPFNPRTSIIFRMAETPAGQSVVSFVSLKVYNVLGQHVATLVNEPRQPGEYEITFDAAGFPSGVYFYTLRAGRFVESKRMMLAK